MNYLAEYVQQVKMVKLVNTVYHINFVVIQGFPALRKLFFRAFSNYGS